MAAKRKVRARAKRVPAAERWTAAKRAAFLSALTETASIVGAERIAGVPERSAYRLRVLDSDFHDAWDDAIEEGYARLELLLLRRATYGEAVDGEDGPAISTSFALGLLKAHQTRAKRGSPSLPAPMRGADLRDRLEAKLAEIHRRLNSGA